MSTKKQHNKEIREKYLLIQEIKANPDWCYCFETLKLEPDVDLENDTSIGKTEPIDGFPYWNSKGYTQDIYLCKRCGKKHCIKIAFA